MRTYLLRTDKKFALRRGQSVADGNAPVYTAAQIARASGYSKRHVLATLSLVSTGTVISVAGNPANAWNLSALPCPLRAALESSARKKGYRSVCDLLNAPVERWIPPFKLEDICASDLEYAKKLRECLRPLLLALGSLDADPSVLKQRALCEFARLFGYAITARRLNQIIELVTERDRGFEEWERLHIYLPKNIKLSKADCKVVEFPGRFEPIDDALGQIEEGRPTADQTACIWKAAIETIVQAKSPSQSERDVKKRVADYLRVHAPWVGRSADAIQRNLNRKLERANSEGLIGLRDRRSESSGNFRRPDFAEDKLLLVHIASLHEGSTSLAHRLLFKGWTNPKDGKLYQFGQAYRDYIRLNCRKNKSRVPEFMRLEAAGPVKSVEPHIFGPHAARMAKPSRLRTTESF